MNKHLTVAMIVAPILAILSYFAVDRAVSESPVAARAGQDYPLVAESKCRYASGYCTLINGDVRLKIVVRQSARDSLMLSLESSLPLDGVVIEWRRDNQQEGGRQMLSSSENYKQWQIEYGNSVETLDGSLRVVAAAQGSRYYGETGLAFAER